MRHSQKLKLLERRRLRGARLLGAGESQAEVARRVGVSRQTVMRWERAREQGGVEALRRAAQFGRPERLSVEQRTELVQILKTGALAAGFGTELWTVPRIHHLIEEHSGSRWSRPRCGDCSDGLAGACNAQRARRERDERAIRTWKQKRWPELKK